VESQGSFETSQKTSPLMRLSPEIIHEVVKYDPGCTIKLAFTCKEMYEVLQDHLKRIHEIVEKNNKLYEVYDKINRIIHKHCEDMGQNHLKACIKISGDLFDNAQCVNCGKLRRERTISFYMEHVCNMCAYKVFNKPQLKSLAQDFEDDIKGDYVRVLFGKDVDKVSEDEEKEFKVFVIRVNGELVKLMLKENNSGDDNNGDDNDDEDDELDDDYRLFEEELIDVRIQADDQEDQIMDMFYIEEFLDGEK